MQKFGIGYDVVVFLDVDKEEVIKTYEEAEKMILPIISDRIALYKKETGAAIDYFRDKKGFISIKIKVKSWEILRKIL